MRFIDFLIEADKPRLRPVQGRYPNRLPPAQMQMFPVPPTQQARALTAKRTQKPMVAKANQPLPQYPPQNVNPISNLEKRWVDYDPEKAGPVMRPVKHAYAGEPQTRVKSPAEVQKDKSEIQFTPQEINQATAAPAPPATPTVQQKPVDQEIIELATTAQTNGNITQLDQIIQAVLSAPRRGGGFRAPSLGTNVVGKGNKKDAATTAQLFAQKLNKKDPREKAEILRQLQRMV